MAVDAVNTVDHVEQTRSEETGRAMADARAHGTAADWLHRASGLVVADERTES